MCMQASEYKNDTKYQTLGFMYEKNIHMMNSISSSTISIKSLIHVNPALPPTPSPFLAFKYSNPRNSPLFVLTISYARYQAEQIITISDPGTSQART